MNDEVMTEEQVPDSCDDISFIGPANKVSLSPESKLIFVARTECKDSELPRRTVRLFYALRMCYPCAAVFVKADETMMRFLQKLGPFVTWGYPTRKSVIYLLYSDGAVKVNKEPRWLIDDNVAELAFGQYNIFSVEDVINEIGNVGPHFEDVSEALRPFSVSS